jgi:hypothetical protein
MRPFRVFSTTDVEKQFPSMNLMNLVRWQKKGYISKLRNSWYAFNDAESHENIDVFGNERRMSRKTMVATPQKAILDFFYINSSYNSEKDIEDLRMNDTELANFINDEFYKLLRRYDSMALERRIRLMIKTYSL